MASRRSYGSGSLYQQGDQWYGRWYLNGPAAAFRPNAARFVAVTGGQA